MEWLQYIPIPLLLVVTVSVNLGSGVIGRHYSKNVSGGLGGFFLFITVSSAVSAIAIAAASGFDLPVSGYTAAVGVAFGVAMSVSAVFNMYSVMIGPWSYTTVITSFSMLIPTLFGAVCWNESIGVTTGIGIAFVACSIVLSVQKKKVKPIAASAYECAAAGEVAACEGGEAGEGTASVQLSPPLAPQKAPAARLSGKWFLCVVLAALGTGAIGILQKTHQKSAFGGEMMTMLVIAFAVETVILAAALTAFVALKGRKAIFSRPPVGRKATAALAALIALSGIAGMLNHIINLYLAGVMNSAVFFPLVNGGNLVLVTLLSIFVYKERLSVPQWVGLGVGIVAVLCLCL